MGLIVARFIGIDYNIGVFVGLLGVLFCSVLGGMRSVTWTQVAQYIILIISYLVPVVSLLADLYSLCPNWPTASCSRTMLQRSSHGGCQGEGDTGALAEGSRRDRHQAQSQRAL